MSIQDELLGLPKEELEKMNLLSQLERDIRQKEHWSTKERHMQLQKWIWIWIGTVVLLALGIIFK